MITIVEIIILCLLATGCSASIRSGGPPNTDNKEVIQSALTLEVKF